MPVGISRVGSKRIGHPEVAEPVDFHPMEVAGFVCSFLRAAAQLQHSSSQTSIFQPEQGLSIRRKLLNPNNRTWDGLVY
jgi:hypothetical protein